MKWLMDLLNKFSAIRMILIVFEIIVPFLAYYIVMKVIAKSTIRLFWKQFSYRDSEQQLKAWYDEVTSAKWKIFNDLKKDFPNASIVGNGRVVFNINRNDYRLFVKIEFQMNAVFIRFIGTHKQYDKLKASEV